jgi:hypothetical protein
VTDADQGVPDDRHGQNHEETTRGPLPVQILVDFDLREEVPHALEFMDEKLGLFGAEIHHAGTRNGKGQAVYLGDLVRRRQGLVGPSLR